MRLEKSSRSIYVQGERKKERESRDKEAIDYLKLNWQNERSTTTRKRLDIKKKFLFFMVDDEKCWSFINHN